MHICGTEPTAVVNAGGVPPLVHMLSSPDDKIVEVGLWALTYIIGGGESLRDFVLSQGFLEPFLGIFKRDSPGYLHAAIPFIVQGLLDFARTPPPFLVVRSVVPLIEQQLRVDCARLHPVYILAEKEVACMAGNASKGNCINV